MGVGLVGLLHEMGVDATLLTPISTGGSVERATDLLRRIGIKTPKRLISPVSYETLASPYVASQVERRPVDMERIWEAYTELREQGKFVVVEGGGLMVPITSRYALVDLLKDFDLPSIIIGKTARGTLNHCILTLRMMLAFGLPPRGFILNGYGQFGDGFAESLNPDVLEELTHPLKVLAVLEWRPEYQENPEAFIRSLKQQERIMSLLEELVSKDFQDPARDR
ncbi:MAG: dethiobiotin synthase [Rhodothermales bacterium]